MSEILSHILMSLKDNVLYVYLFVFVVAFLESFAFLGLLVPGAAVVVSIGFLASKGYFDVCRIVGFAVVGAILADIVSFFMGNKYFFHIKKTKIYAKYESYFEKGEQFFKKYGGISVFIGRFIGFLRPVIPFVAGTLNMDKTQFLFWAVLSGVIWGVSYIGVGYLSGKGVDIVVAHITDADYLIVSGFIVLITVYVVVVRLKRK